MLRGVLAWAVLSLGCAAQQVPVAKDPCGDQYGNCMNACRDRSRGGSCSEERTLDLTCMRSASCVTECDRLLNACKAGAPTTAVPPPPEMAPVP
jgi:hypothetical protein